MDHAALPLRLVGPIRVIGETGTYDVKVPLATFESPLWPSVGRGAKATLKAGGISTVVLHDAMARSVAFEAGSAVQAAQIVRDLEARRKELFSIAEGTSRFLVCQQMLFRIVGSCIYLRLSGSTGDASGHNMITKGADAILQWICANIPGARYLTVSGNYCTDKKVSSVNAILGRGKSVVADILVPDDVCRSVLKSTPEAIAELNVKKNLLGSILNGGVQSANAHFANMLLAFYLATGQDAANIVEGSQGIAFAEVRNKDLYFSVTIPNIIVGTVGHGKDRPEVHERLAALGCMEERPSGQNARRLAEIAAATVLCGELNLLAAQTKPGELVRSHMVIERRASQ